MSDVQTKPGMTLVWDRGVRIFHWGLVASITMCAWTGFIAPRNWLNLHLAAGAAVAALVCYRLIWGATGSTYARFRSFWPSLAAIRLDVTAILRGRPQRHVGHNPLGSVMIFALLGALVLLAGTGLVALGGALKQGPLAFAVPFSIGWRAREIHALLAWALLVMVASHLGGVAFETLLTRENIVRAMITGRKRAPEVAPTVSLRAHPALASAIFAAIAVVAVYGVISLSRLPANGVPAASLDPVYQRECGGCHFAYPPSLGGATLWAAVINGLDDHFGENASLDPATMAQLLVWLTAGSAEHFDTLPANLFRWQNSAEPQRVTATSEWTRIHQDIPASVFSARSVGVKGACQACHADAASGRFDPQSISVPKDAYP